MYYHRPAEELIFLPRSEHEAFRKGKPRSAETRNKLSTALKGRQFSVETRNKMSEAAKGKKFSDEHKKRMSEAMKGENNPAFGTRWFNNGEINKRCYECPEGFVPGRILS